jgi:hypothetical protein
MPSADATWVPEDFPLDTPNASRMYDYYLGGYHNFAIDRETAEQAIRIYPEFPLIMRANRAFLRRAVTFLAQQGIDQFLDIGSGIPTVGSVHEVAQRVNPAARVVYVDIDPIAVAHSDGILAGNPHATAVGADARHPEQLLGHPDIRHRLNFDRPLAVLLVFVLHFIGDDATVAHSITTLREALAPGSYLVLSHGTAENLPPEQLEQLVRLYERSTSPWSSRSRHQVEQLFRGLEMVEPGVVWTPIWRPESPHDLYVDHPERSASYAGVGRKP